MLPFAAVEVCVGAIVNISVLKSAAKLPNVISRRSYSASVYIDSVALIGDILGHVLILTYADYTATNRFSLPILAVAACVAPFVAIVIAVDPEDPVDIDIITLVPSPAAKLCFTSLSFAAAIALAFPPIVASMVVGRYSAYIAPLFILCVATCTTLLATCALVAGQQYAAGYLCVALTALPAVLSMCFTIASLAVDLQHTSNLRCHPVYGTF